ncbi:Uncharacterized protein HZ326_22301 [Fusarium oxysporum f. sp. albedinis]|nr:Uncharacterized protein HZ326_22301 [Fusarium oxysporum f. sp. albedinis]
MYAKKKKKKPIPVLRGGIDCFSLILHSGANESCLPYQPTTRGMPYLKEPFRNCMHGSYSPISCPGNIRQHCTLFHKIQGTAQASCNLDD